MLIEVLVIVSVAAVLVWLVAYMRAQKPATSVQRLIQENRYGEAIAEADRMIASGRVDSTAHVDRAEAEKLQGNFEEALRSYRDAMRIDPRDGAPPEGIALTLTYLGRDLGAARQMMEETIASFPQIQEFQALALAFILLRSGQRELALRLYEDNAVLLQTRFTDDYTDPDPLLVETLFHYSELARAAGQAERAALLSRRVAEWAPASIFARWSKAASP
jgi:tetratricopeptide (TPR) repeat protein